MILKGNQRGGGRQLAVHLMNSFDNERVEVAEVRGAVAQDLSGAFDEWNADASVTNCKKYLYSFSASPDPAQGTLTREQYLDLLDRTERSLKLVGQPRAVVFHVKNGREHCHAVWSRIDTEHQRAVQIAHDRLKLRTVARNFCRDYGLELPDGLRKDGKAKRFNDTAKENLAEKQQQERTGVRKAERVAEITACWTSTQTGADFVRALEAKDYYLARGDSGRYVVVDLYGEIHSLYRQIDGVRSAAVKDRLKDFPLKDLRDVEAAQDYAREKREQKEKALANGGQEASAAERKPDLLELRKQALIERQAKRRAELDKQRADMYAGHFAERGALRQLQADEHGEVTAARAEKQPKGLAAFLTRMTGIGRLREWVQGKADSMRESRHKAQTEALLRRQQHEMKEMERHYSALERLETRENRSAATAALRESYRKLRERTFALTPEFRKAQARQVAIGGIADEGKEKALKIRSLFERLAYRCGFTKGDLQAAFARATSMEQHRTEKGGEDLSPADRAKLDQARRIRDEYLKRQPQKGPDLDREKEM